MVLGRNLLLNMEKKELNRAKPIRHPVLRKTIKIMAIAILVILIIVIILGVLIDKGILK